MGIRIFLGVLAVGGILWYLSWYHKASPEQRNHSLRSVTLYGIGGALLLLVITGRIPWLFALFSAAVPWINRLLATKRLWTAFNQFSGGAKHTQSQSSKPRPIDSMTTEEALEILGLQGGATREEIIQAHRKLMSKVHPDKGGSHYLARCLNQARKVLLGE